MVKSYPLLKTLTDQLMEVIRMYDFKVQWCPICNQGWVEIVKDTVSGQLFCCCSECENEWDDVKNISNKTCNKEYRYGCITDPDYEEVIEKNGILILSKNSLVLQLF